MYEQQQQQQHRSASAAAAAAAAAAIVLCAHCSGQTFCTQGGQALISCLVPLGISLPCVSYFASCLAALPLFFSLCAALSLYCALLTLSASSPYMPPVPATRSKPSAHTADNPAHTHTRWLARSLASTASSSMLCWRSDSCSRDSQQGLCGCKGCGTAVLDGQLVDTMLAERDLSLDPVGADRQLHLVSAAGESSVILLHPPLHLY